MRDYTGTLQYRRKGGDLIETYKMPTGRENINASVFFRKATYTGLKRQQHEVAQARLQENMQTEFLQPESRKVK